MEGEEQEASTAVAATNPRGVLAQARRQFRREVRQAPKIWQPALEEVAKALFDRPLELWAVRRRHKVDRASHSEAFRAKVGATLEHVVRRYRLATAARLGSELGLPHRQIAALVGYASAGSLRSARGQARHTALVLPAPARAAASGACGVPPPSQLEAQLQQFFFLALEEASAAELREQLSERAEHAEALRSELPQDPEAWLPELWWERLRELPEEVQSQAIRAGFHLETPAMFHYLRRLSRVEGRADRRRGVTIARSAMASLEPLSSVLASAEHSQVVAHGWITLGNAQRLAGEHAEAEEAFANAEVLLGELPPSPVLTAELACGRCLLRCQERRFGEALVLVNQAVALSEGEPDALLTALLCRGGVCHHLADWAQAAADYQAAQELAAGGELYLRLAASHNLAASLFFGERYEAAEAELERSKVLAEQLGDASVKPHCRRFEGLLASQAGELATGETKLTEAREGWRELGEWGNFATVSLDLAMVLLGAGRAEEAVVVVSDALPHLEALRFEGEGLAAFRLLQRAVAAQQVSMVVIEKVRASARLLLGARPS